MSTPSSLYTIRPYRREDRPSVRKIFMETAFHGESFQNFFDDGEWLADVMTTGYIDHEPEACFVADCNGIVEGYLTGALNTARYRRRWVQHVLPGLARNFFLRGIWKNKRARTFFINGFKSSLRGEEKFPPRLFQSHPAHFHINLQPKLRGRGVGTKLAAAFFEHMRRNNVPAVHIRTSFTDPHQPFFESLGFRLLQAQRLTVWDYLGAPPYYLMTYGLSLRA